MLPTPPDPSDTEPPEKTIKTWAKVIGAYIEEIPFFQAMTFIFSGVVVVCLILWAISTLFAWLDNVHPVLIPGLIVMAAAIFFGYHANEIKKRKDAA